MLLLENEVCVCVCVLYKEIAKRAGNSLIKCFSSRLGGQTLGTEESRGDSS